MLRMLMRSVAADSIRCGAADLLAGGVLHAFALNTVNNAWKPDAHMVVSVQVAMLQRRLHCHRVA